MEFRKTDSFDAGVAAVNAVDPQKLYPLLERVVAKLHLQEDVLTSEEMAQFTSRFNLEAHQANIIIRVCTFVFSKALENQASEQELAMSLKEGGVQEKHCLAFATAWNREKDQLLKRIKKESFGAPAALESVDWKVHLQVKGSEADVEQIIPKAVFELLLQDQQKDGTAAKSISMELNREELERLYNNFEEIQGQLDALT